jgi:hypothetical protein
MKKPAAYDNFPIQIPVLANSFSLLIYFLGASILSGFNLWVAILYLAYCLVMETNIMRRSCIHCYYYDKICGLGKGKLCAKFFKKGQPEKFSKKDVNLLKLIPDFLVFIIPLVGGVILLIRSFNWGLLGLMALLFVLTFFGNALIRGQLVCKFCKQRLLNCPADKFFNKKR